MAVAVMDVREVKSGERCLLTVISGRCRLSCGAPVEPLQDTCCTLQECSLRATLVWCGRRGSGLAFD